ITPPAAWRRRSSGRWATTSKILWKISSTRLWRRITDRHHGWWQPGAHASRVPRFGSSEARRMRALPGRHTCRPYTSGMYEAHAQLDATPNLRYVYNWSRLSCRLRLKHGYQSTSSLEPFLSRRLRVRPVDGRPGYGN